MNGRGTGFELHHQDWNVAVSRLWIFQSFSALNCLLSEICKSLSVCIVGLKQVAVAKMYMQPIHWVDYWHCLHLGKVLHGQSPSASPNQLHS